MFDTFRRSWELTNAGLSVLRSDKELLIFPFVSSPSGIATFGGPR